MPVISSGIYQRVLHVWLIVRFSEIWATPSSKWFRDTSFDNKTSTSGFGLITRSLVHCAETCAEDVTCRSFFFARGNHENCRILNMVLTLESHNILDLVGSAYYIVDKYPGIIFRSTVGIGTLYDTAEAWLAAGPGTTTNTYCRNVRIDGCSKHYRHPIIDDWTTLNPQKVRYSIYKNEVEVAWVLFNATGSNKTNWFHQSRVLSSSYTDLTPTNYYRGFKLDFSYSGVDRHFYVSGSWGGCSGDDMWLCTFDNGYACSFDNYGNWPYILYSKLGHKANTGNMGDFDFGDCSIVAVVN